MISARATRRTSATISANSALVMALLVFEPHGAELMPHAFSWLV